MMEPNIKWIVSEKIGKVSGIVQINDDSKFILLLGHGAGAGMHHIFMEQLALELLSLNIGVIRYQFPYMENGKRRPDFPNVCHLTIETILKDIHEKYVLPIFLGGKSFGGRMSSQLLALKPNLPVKGLIFYGFPFHSPKKVNLERAEHLKKISVPMLFLQGAKDKLAIKELIEPFLRSLEMVKYVSYPNADHSFKRAKKWGSMEDMLHSLAVESREFIHKKEAI